MKRQRVLVTGAGGQLGYYVCKELQVRNVPCLGLSSKEADITDYNMVKAYFFDYRPTAVIHCAAWTAVDLAEKKPSRARLINERGTGNIVSVCKLINAKMLYMSTDYVFSGEKQGFYEVDDDTGPLNNYGYGKLLGEKIVQTELEQFFIVRTSWLYSARGHNFVKNIIELCKSFQLIQVISDQIGSPTYAPELAKLLCDIIVTDKYGVYHATGEGSCSWAEFAQEIVRLTGVSTQIVPVTSAEYAASARRPLNSLLSKKSLDAAGIPRMPDWKDSLKQCIAEIQQGNEC